MSKPTIIVQMDDAKWTWAAMYEACALAREKGAEVALVKFLPVEYLSWMVDESGAFRFSDSESEDIRSYQAIADEHDVPFSTHIFQYANLDETIVQAADKLNADTVFVTLPRHMLPLFDRMEVRSLQRKLHEHHHALRTFDAPAALVT